VDPADFPRFKELGGIADFQLEWAKREPATEGPLEPYLGPDRYKYLYPAGSLHKAGAMIIGGSDWDISSYNPFRAFQTGVARSGGKGQKPLNIDEKIPLETAIDAYTINAAYAMKQDKPRTRRRSPPISTGVWSIPRHPAARPRTMTRMPGNGGTRARRACASGCTGTKASSG
jgi:hypothetical protein